MGKMLTSLTIKQLKVLTAVPKDYFKPAATIAFQAGYGSGRNGSVAHGVRPQLIALEKKGFLTVKRKTGYPNLYKVNENGKKLLGDL